MSDQFNLEIDKPGTDGESHSPPISPVGAIHANADFSPFASSSSGRTEQSTSTSSRSSAAARTGSATPARPSVTVVPPPSTTISPSVRARYYRDLPSRPKLLATTRLDLSRKNLFPVDPDQRLSTLWDSIIAPGIAHTLGGIPGSCSVELWRIGPDAQHARQTVWIGLSPGAVSDSLASVIAVQAKDLCRSHGVNDIEVEVKACQIKQLSKLLDPEDFPPSIANCADPYYSTLGTPFSCDPNPHCLGTGSLFMKVPTEDRLLLLTAQHCLVGVQEPGASLRPNAVEQRQIARLAAPDTFIEHKREAQTQIRNERWFIKTRSDQIRNQQFKGRDSSGLEVERAAAQFRLQSMKVWLTKLKEDYGTEAKRIFAQTWGFPEVSYNADGTNSEPHKPNSYTADWGFLLSDVEPGSRPVNVLNLQSDRSFAARSPNDFPALPDDIIDYLPVTGYLSSDELRHPHTVLKRGASSKLTIGRTNGVDSYRRKGKEWTRELGIIGYEGNNFSERGDSGSIVMDRRGRLCGLLTSGNGNDLSSLREGGGIEVGFQVDVTYVTAWWWLQERFRRFGIDPVLA